MTYVVRLLKVGSVAEGDSQDDFGPGKVNPFSEFPVVPGFFLQDQNASVLDKLVGIQRIPGTQSLQFVDSSGTVTLANILSHTGVSQLGGTNSDVTTPAGGGEQVATVVSVGGVSATNIGSLYNTLTGSTSPSMFYATPASAAGVPGLRNIAANDVPSLPVSKITGLAASATTDATNASNISSGSLNIARIDTSAGTEGTYLKIVGGVLTYASVAASGGTVTSVALQLPASIYSSSGSAITTAGTITPTLAPQAAHSFWGGPSSGGSAAPGFRSMVAADIPTLSYSQISGLAASATTDATNATNITTGSLSLARLNTGTATAGQVIGYNGSAVGWVTPGSGTVTSVGLTVPGFLSVTPGAITSSGTFAVSLANQSVGMVFAGPVSGNAAAPGFRALTATDIPTLSYSQISGLAASATTDTTNASNISSGTLLSARLVGPYGGITGLGSLASLVLGGSTSGTLTISAAATTTSYALVMPAAQGTANSTLINDGSGNLTWGTASGGSASFPLSAPINTGYSAAPYAFAGNAGSGMLYDNSSSTNSVIINSASGDVRIATNGNARVIFYGFATQIANQVRSIYGSTAAVPQYSFTQAINSGLYYDGTNTGVSAGGSPFIYGSSAAAIIPVSLALSGSNSGAVTLKAAASTTAYTLAYPAAQGAAGQTLLNDGSGNLSWGAAGSGTVTSVGMTVPSFLAVTPSSITSSGTFAVSLAAQTAATVFAGPASGGSVAPTFRSLQATDIPTLSYSQISGLAASATTDTTNATNISSGSLALARLNTTGATSGQLLQYNGSAPVWATPASSFPAAYQTFSNTSSHTSLASENGTIYQQSGTSGTFTLTLAVGTSSTNLNFGIANFASGAATTVVAIPTNGGLYYSHSATPVSGSQTIQSTDPLSFMSVAQSPSSSAYLVQMMSGKWTVMSGGNVVQSIINNWLTDPTTVNTIGAASVANTVVSRDASSNFASNIATLNGVALLGSTSGFAVSLKAAAASATYTLTAPAAQGSAGQTLQNDGSGNLSWVTPSGASINTPSAIVQRDAYGAINVSLAVQVFANTSSSHTLAGTESGTQFQLQGGSSNALTLTLVANPTSQAYQATAAHLATAGAVYTVAPVSGSSILYPQGSTTGSLVSTTPMSVMTLTGEPNSSVYAVSSLTGVWKDSATSGILIGTLSADAGATGVATTANTAYAVMLRDSAGGFVAGAGSMSSILVRGSASGAVTISGPSSGVVTSYPVRMPAAQGAAGTVPVNDGSGNLSWAIPTATSGLPASVTVVNQLTAYTFTSADRGKLFTNNNATAITIYTLPTAPAIGDTYWAAAQNQTNYIKVQQGNASHLIYLPAAVTTAGTTHGIAYTSNTRGGPGVIALTYVAANTWCWSGGYPFDWAAY